MEAAAMDSASKVRRKRAVFTRDSLPKHEKTVSAGVITSFRHPYRPHQRDWSGRRAIYTSHHFDTTKSQQHGVNLPTHIA
jgi:hypothetical protein